jgi:hypothetical protein
MYFGNMYFGETEFDLVDQEPERLRQVAGIGAKRAVRIVKTYSQSAIQRIAENPHRRPGTFAASAPPPRLHPRRGVVGSFFPPPVPSPSQYPLPVARVRGVI